MRHQADSYVRAILRRMGLLEICRRTEGRSAFQIGLIDGEVYKNHPSLTRAMIKQLPSGEPLNTTSLTTRHATFISSILVGRGNGVVGLCPGCTLVSVPAVSDEMICGKISVAATVDRLRNAVDLLVADGVNVIQLSLEFPEPARRAFEALSEALVKAASKGILVVIPVGNLAILDSNFILASDGVIPIAMSDWNGLPHTDSALDPAAARRGLLALGVDIPGALSPEGYTRRSGTSYAAAFVTGALALLDAADSRLAAMKFRDAFLSRIAASAHTNRMIPSPLDLESLFALKM